MSNVELVSSINLQYGSHFGTMRLLDRTFSGEILPMSYSKQGVTNTCLRFNGFQLQMKTCEGSSGLNMNSKLDMQATLRGILNAECD